MAYSPQTAAAQAALMQQQYQQQLQQYQQQYQRPQLAPLNGYGQAQASLLPPLRQYASTGGAGSPQPASPLSPAGRAYSGYSAPPQPLLPPPQQAGPPQGSVYAALRASQQLQQPALVAPQAPQMPHPLAPVPPATAGYAAAGYAAPPMPPGVAAATAASAATAATVAQQQYYALAQQQQQMLQEAAAQAALQAPVAPPAVLAAAYMTPQQQAAMGLNPGAMGYGAGATGYGAGMAGAAGYGAGMAGAAGYGAGMAGAAPAGAPPALQPGAAGAMQAPGQQAMTAAGGYAGNLEALPGVVIKETTQVLDAVVASIGGAYEAANKYHVRVLPSHVRPATEPNQPGTWAPSSKEVDMLPEVMFVQEDSSCCLRVCLAAFGSLNLRALQLHGYEGSIEALTVDRPCKMGAGCCCPLEMTITSKGQQIGMVIEDADSYCGMCYQQCCTCTYTQKVMMGSTRESLVHKYSLVTPLWCCGRVNNCCGATCCKPNLFIDVVSPDGKLVNAVQKTYGAGGAGDCCRSMFDFSNYILPFPPGSSHQERLALIVGVLSVEYAYFSRKGGEGNDDSN